MFNDQDCLNDYDEYERENYGPAPEYFQEPESVQEFQDPNYTEPILEIKNHFGDDDGEYHSEFFDSNDESSTPIIKVSTSKKIRKVKGPSPKEILKKKPTPTERNDTVIKMFKSLTINEKMKNEIDFKKDFIDDFKKISLAGTSGFEEWLPATGQRLL